MSIYKRSIIFILTVIFAISFSFIAVACDTAGASDDCKFAVKFLSLGNDECTIIKLPDGKVAVIDAGGNKSESIFSDIDRFADGRIDYLVITSPKAENIGAVKFITEKYRIGKAFVPSLCEPASLPLYSESVNALKGVTEVIVYDLSTNIIGNDYFIAFLSPESEESTNAFYNALNNSFSVSDLDYVSPIIYMEYGGVRFVFESESSSSAQNEVYDRYFAGLYDLSLNNSGRSVDLYNVDFLKVSNHGSASHYSYSFAGVLKPRNVVFSLAGDNSFGYPSTSVLNDLAELNPEVRFLRTDVLGSVTVNVASNGNIRIKSDKIYL